MAEYAKGNKKRRAFKSNKKKKNIVDQGYRTTQFLYNKHNICQYMSVGIDEQCKRKSTTPKHQKM